MPLATASVAPAGASENALREERYAALAGMARAAGADAVVTAHTAEDQSETVLLALFRGTGPEGLAGIPESRELAPGVDLVRPLLRFTHAELARYLLARGLPCALDPSNAETRQRRNAVRAALDQLRPQFPRLDAAVARCAEIARAEREGAGRARLRRRVRDALREGDAVRDVPFERIEEAVAAIEAGRSGRFFMKRGVEVRVTKEGGP